jgi:hypothetical protein
MAIQAPPLARKDFFLLPEGEHLGFCDLIVDLGLQNTLFRGRLVVRRQLYIGWQVPGHRVQWRRRGKDFEGPARIKKIYTLSLEKGAHLRDDVERWRGVPFATAADAETFDLVSLLGMPARLIVEHEYEKGKTYARLRWVFCATPEEVNDRLPEGDLIAYDGSAAHADRLIDLPIKVQNLLAEQVQSDRQGRDSAA